MTNLTAEQVLALAPDSGIAASGRGLASTKKWSNLGRSEIVAWGNCQGSGKDPYRVQIDLREPAFRCSCPSRKFPCKHGIGLLLLLVNQPNAFSTGEAPDWVKEWLAKREQTTQRKQASAEAPVDQATLKRRAAAQERRATSREDNVVAGLDELARWLDDRVRQGLASCQSSGPKLWDSIAARMVDVQAPGIARMLRDMASIPASGDGWQTRLLERFTRLHLIIQGYRNREQLPPELLAELRTQIGWSQDRESVLASPAVRDQWLVLGQTREEEQQLITQRTWLWGRTSQRPALVVQFIGPGQQFEQNLLVGTTLDADLHYFTSSMPLRVVVGQAAGIAPTPAPSSSDGYASIDDALAAYAAGLTHNPWIERFPMLLHSVTPHLQSERWYISDADQRVLPLANRGIEAWRLLGMSAGLPMALFGTWDGQRLSVLSGYAKDVGWWPVGA